MSTTHTPKARREAASFADDLRELTTARGIPARPLLGVLPIRRIVPQDLHALGDYGDGVRVLVAGLLTRSRTARRASLALGATVLTVSYLTDYRLAPFKLIPIEAHEVIDHLWGAAAIAAPFALGYAKRAPITAALHVLVGATHIAVSLFTDYRAARGVGHEADPERIGTAQLA